MRIMRIIRIIVIVPTSSTKDSYTVTKALCTLRVPDVPRRKHEQVPSTPPLLHFQLFTLNPRSCMHSLSAAASRVRNCATTLAPRPDHDYDQLPAVDYVHTRRGGLPPRRTTPRPPRRDHSRTVVVSIGAKHF